MTAALAMVVLLTVSLFVVRIASVALRLTGLSDDVARFQSLSALTGTGFTTHEAEMIVNYPLRRRILASLMVFGNLGLVSVAATLIVTFVGFDQSQSSILLQVVLLFAAILFTVVMATNKTIDRGIAISTPRSGESLVRCRDGQILFGRDVDEISNT